jgi:ribosomal protein S18 acetylase RimI-like enzyme
MSSDCEIRMANAADIPAMIRVINAAFSIETFLEGKRVDAEQLSTMMETGTFFLATQGGTLRGSIYAELRGERCVIAMLAVDPAHQGTSTVRAVVRAAEDYCREHGCKYADITVLSQRAELPPVYRRFGYVQTGTKEFESAQQLKDGVQCNTLLLTKQL